MSENIFFLNLFHGMMLEHRSEKKCIGYLTRFINLQITVLDLLWKLPDTKGKPKLEIRAAGLSKLNKFWITRALLAPQGGSD